MEGGEHCKERNMKKETLERDNEGNGFQRDHECKGKGKTNLKQSVGYKHLEKEE